MTDIRVTREVAEVLSNLTTTPDVRVTRQTIEVLSDFITNPEVRVTRQVIEVLASNDDVPVLSSSAAVVVSINYIYVE